MTTAVVSDLTDVRETRERAPRPAPRRVATRGDPASDGAVELAYALATATGSAVHVLAVVTPQPASPPQLGTFVQLTADDIDGRLGLERTVANQLRRLGVGARKVAVDVRTGDPPSTIVRAAREAGARLILLGAADHDLLGRMLGADTTARVTQSADVPVIVVPRGCALLPGSALIAVDFSEASVRAGRTAVTLFPDLDVVHLVHVAPSVPVLDLIGAAEGRYVVSAEHAFDEVRDALPLCAGTVVGREIARGSPARELLRIARERQVDLIVAGSRGHGALHRLFMGSVAAAMLRGARVPVLILPASADFTVRAARGSPEAARQRPTSQERVDR